MKLSTKDFSFYQQSFTGLKIKISSERNYLLKKQKCADVFANIFRDSRYCSDFIEHVEFMYSGNNFFPPYIEEF